ncbi:uncharacterized protein SCODWIG_02656 [Saccharomycodes ludwigii]|uniref:ubiquitinyl hydrolase 1 n=1 Tax=Saccharomycodes ludwigii TaxID=36035 RepID=A0A376B8A5_9ASCO|nr:uncharacterized protein SCODWIG_02656 [Saccharomycodes ludwigii]
MTELLIEDETMSNSDDINSNSNNNAENDMVYNDNNTHKHIHKHYHHNTVSDVSIQRDSYQEQKLQKHKDSSELPPTFLPPLPKRPESLVDADTNRNDLADTNNSINMTTDYPSDNDTSGRLIKNESAKEDENDRSSSDSISTIESQHNGTGDIIPNIESNNEEQQQSKEVLEIELPPIEEQREIIRTLHELNEMGKKEGDEMFIIPHNWFNAFLNDPKLDVDFNNNAQEVTEEEEEVNPFLYLGSINTDSIVIDYDNFILKDYNTHPYTAVCKTVFNQLTEWYGLIGKPIITYLVENQKTHELIIELSWLCFNYHVFTDEMNIDLSRNKSAPFFCISRLANIKAILTKCLNSYITKEDVSELPDVRYWISYDEIDYTDNGGEDPAILPVVSLDKYIITPWDFATIDQKIYINENKILNSSFKNVPVYRGHVILEFKTGKHWPSNFFVYNKFQPSNGLIGLNNLGNSCYMNSALQCLAHIPELKDYFLYDVFLQELNVDNPLGYKGAIANSFAGLIKSLFKETIKIDNDEINSSFAPRNFKTTIGYCNSMFKGYLQQDSQEFINFLLDGLHEDLNRVIKKPYVEKSELPPGTNVNDQQIIENLAQNTWEKHKLRNNSIILDLFVGLYKSTLTCPECKNVSVTFDPFNDLTLPLPVERFWSRSVVIFRSHSEPSTLDVELPNTATYQDLKKYIESKLQNPTNASSGASSSSNNNNNMTRLVGYECFNHQFYKNYEEENSDSQYLPINELISSTDIVVFNELENCDIAADECNFFIPVLNVKLETEFPTPSLFGYPFIVNFSRDELFSFGAVLYKMAEKLQNLTGLKLLESDVDIYEESIRKKQEFEQRIHYLQQKYPNISNLHEILQKEYQYWKHGIPGCFKLKVYNNNDPATTSTTVGDLDDQHNKTVSNEDCPLKENYLYVPNPHITLSKITDITDNVDPVVLELYGVITSYDETVDVIEQDQSSKSGSDMDIDEESETNKGEQQQQQPEVESIANNNVFIPPSSFEDSDVNLISTTTAPSPLPNKTIVSKAEIQSKCLFTSETPTLIVEWNNMTFKELFKQNFSWNQPQKYKNKELDDIKLKRRENNKSKHITLDDCLKLFSKPEVLGVDDSWYCPQCKVHRQATKQIELWSTPDILLVQLKRFENQSSFSDKIDAVVDFPITDFDVSQYLVRNQTGTEKSETIYDLFAVDNHYGGLGGGHYTAYVKNCVDNKWYYFDDSRVTATSPEQSVSGSAYLLFYRRRTTKENEAIGGANLKKIIEINRLKNLEAMEEFEEQQLTQFEMCKTDDEDDDNAKQEDDDTDVESEGKRDDEYDTINGCLNSKEKDNCINSKTSINNNINDSDRTLNENIKERKEQLNEEEVSNSSNERKKLRISTESF